MSNCFGVHEKYGVQQMKITLRGTDRDEFLLKTEEFVFFRRTFF